MTTKTKGTVGLLLLAALVIALAVVPNSAPVAARPTVTSPLAPQDPTQGMDMSSAPNRTINGGQEADKIKDLDAWQMFLLGGKDVSSNDEVRFAFHITLSDAQADQIQQVVLNFNSQWASVEANYGVVADANLRNGIDNKLNEKYLRRSQKQLVRDAQAKIEDILGPDAADFHSMLQFYKHSMSIAVEEEDSN